MKLSEMALNVKESSTLSITAMAKQLSEQGADLAAFTAGEPDFDTPEHIKKAAIDATNSGFTKYTPSSGTVDLRKAICAKLKKDNSLSYEPNQIVVSNGAKHSLSNIFLSILNKNDEVIIPAPFWLSYPEMVHIAGGKSIIVHTSSENGFKLTVTELEKAYTKNTKALILNSPNNPTGAVYSKEELEQIAEFAIKNDIIVIADEIYENLVYSGIQHISIASLSEEIFKRTIIVNGFSKGYAMTGWRLGYTASSKEIADAMGNIQSHMTSNPNSMAQKGAVVALTGDQASVENMRVEFEKRRNYIYDRAKNIPLISCNKPDGAFYLFIDVSGLLNDSLKSAKDIADVLLKEYSVVVVPCADFGFPNHIRLSYAISMEDITKGMDRIEKFVSEKY
ncbi:MAG: pyridoxal phosphate-dependent aminotransferase [Defluviitaleaceae bacterium]|nr:pyridoxal phosphate-dependent aminotransferase [Defluviitaleaceae bacterium]